MFQGAEVIRPAERGLGQISSGPKLSEVKKVITKFLAITTTMKITVLMISSRAHLSFHISFFLFFSFPI